jgi:hypothetical protein
MKVYDADGGWQSNRERAMAETGLSQFEQQPAGHLAEDGVKGLPAYPLRL